MKKTFTRLLAVAMCVVMTLTAAPLGGFVGLELPSLFDFRAEAASYSGTCGDNFTWTLDTDTGLLEISGTGEMRDYKHEAPWEDYLSYIKMVRINNGVTTIGDKAFAYCDNLTSVTIPDSVTSIGDQVFWCCDSLTSVTIPAGVTYIGVWAFAGCSALNDITVDENNQCYSSDSYGVLFNKEKTVLIQYPVGNARTSYVIPNSVITIGEYAFALGQNLVDITIPYGVKFIGADAFGFCSNLKNINIPDSVVIINDLAFEECESLISVTIGNGVTTIGLGAFGICTSLTSVTIGKNVKIIDEHAFAYCKKLVDVYYVSTEDDWNKISIGSDNEYLTDATIHFTEPEPVIASGECGENLTWTLYESGLLKITGTGAMTDWQSEDDVPWSSCKNSIKSVNIAEGIISIGDYTFSGCDGLTDIYYDSTEEKWNQIKIGYENEALTNATIRFTDPIVECGICGINLTWFLYSSGLLEITGSGAMYDWEWDDDIPWYSLTESIKKVNIGDGATTIGNYAFFYCDSLASINISGNVTSIGYSAFWYCTSLTSITIPDSVTFIAELAFTGCPGLTSITVDENNQCYSNDRYGVLFNKDKTTLVQYPSGNTRTSYTIPDSVTKIGGYAFGVCYGLESVTLPDSVTTIGNYAFVECYKLTNITIPDSVITIGDSAFSSCTGLTNITIPDSVITIGGSAFSSCTGLTSVTIPDSVTSIGERAFADCTSPTSVTIGNSVTTIGDGAFAYCESLTSVTLGNSLTTIGNYAFYNCTGLTSVTLGNSLTTIGNYAFCNCTGFTSITIPDSVITIGDMAFAYCSNLTSVTIGSDVTTIGYGAFGDCTSLKSVTIPGSVKTIGDAAFYYCYCLNDVYYGSTRADWNKIKIGSDNDDLTSATIHYNWIIHDHNYIWLVETVPTTTQVGKKKRVCTICGETTGESVDIPATSFETTNGMLVDYASNMVFGLAAGISSLEGFATVVVDGCEWEYVEGKNGFGTGTKAIIKNGDEIIEEYTVVIFGDIDGDGWYDANDAFIVNMIASGLIPADRLSAAQFRAADCNHDGVINELDFELLINASLMLEDVDQSATKEELATNAMYISYCSLIDQTAGEETNLIPVPDNDEAPSDTTADAAPSEPVEVNDFEAIFTMIIDFFKKIFTFVFSFVIK